MNIHELVEKERNGPRAESADSGEYFPEDEADFAPWNDDWSSDGE